MSVVHRWLAEPLPRDVAKALERLAAARGVEHVAVMPDVHLAEHVCVGTVVGTDRWLYPQAVGGDIGCGIAALRIDAERAALADREAASRVFAALRERVPSIRHRRPRDVALDGMSDERLRRAILRDARVEFGTIGRGNHFLEIQVDDDERLWLAVHTGSRCVGPAIAAHHLARGERVGKGLVALATPGAGDDYLRDTEVAVAFARSNRLAVVRAAGEALAASIGVALDEGSMFDVVHNFVRRERHDDRELFVHRKGASSAALDERGIVPGSMGTRTFHVAGRGCAAALCSSSHGAGRCMPRGEAARRIGVRELEREMRSVFFERELAPQLRDEAPSAYKDVGAVMRAQHALVAVTRTLRPVLCFKGV